MSDASMLPLVKGDVVAVHLAPGPPWREIVERLWGAEAALFPVDHRLAGAAVDDLLARAQPTVVVDETGWHRLGSGRPADGSLAAVVATSGSRDLPRLVELSRVAVTAAVEASLQALGAGRDDGWVSCLPLCHIGGLLVVLRCVLGEAPLHFQDPSDLTAPRGSAFTSVVPTMLERALEAGQELAGYRALLVGGAALPPALAARAIAAGAGCIATYGLTQSCGGVVYDGLPLPGVRMRIDDSGEVELAGPTLMRGFRDAAGGTDAGFTGDGWLRTGDSGRIGGGGRLEVSGRLDDMIVTGGEKVWPSAVEAVLREHPEVADVAVVARADPTWGHRVVAVVVARDSGSPPVLADLRDHVGAALGRLHAPWELVLVDRLPRSALGKVVQGDLERAAQGGGDAPLGDDGRR